MGLENSLSECISCKKRVIKLSISLDLDNSVPHDDFGLFLLNDKMVYGKYLLRSSLSTNSIRTTFCCI